MTLLNFTFQESSPLISYSLGQWTEGKDLVNYTCVCEDSDDGSYITTEAFGATATLSFLGTGISLFGAKNDTHGNFSVQVDQNLFIEIGFSQISQLNVSLFGDYGLEYGQHTVAITNLPASNNSVFDLGAISIERQLGPPGYHGTIFTTYLDDTASWVSYTGEWTQVPSTTAFQDTLHLTTQESAQVTVYFQGSSIELYGRYANAPFIVQLDDTPPISLTGPQIDLAPEDEHPRTLLYLMDSLSEEVAHTVTLTNSGSDINRPFFFDYAIVRSSKQYFNAPASTNTSTFLSSSSSKDSSSASSSVIIGAVIGGVLGFLFLVFCGVMLIRRYCQGNVLRRFRRYSHTIMPFIIAGLSPGQQSAAEMQCTNHETASEKVQIQIPTLPTPPIPIAVPLLAHFPDVYGMSPYRTLHTPSAASQSFRGRWTIDADDVSQGTKSISTPTSTLTGATSSQSSATATFPLSNYLGIPTAFTLSPVREENAGHRSLPPDYNSVWSSDSDAGTYQPTT